MRCLIMSIIIKLI